MSDTETPTGEWVVSDSKDVPIGSQIPIIGRFPSEQEAAEFIGKLPECETGRYNLDPPYSDDDIEAPILPEVPADHPVKALTPAELLKAAMTDDTDIVKCGLCGRSWNDAVITSLTPAPSARCPFEYYHPDVSDISVRRDSGRYTPAINIKVSGVRADFEKLLPLELGQTAEVGSDVFTTHYTDPRFTFEWIDEHLTEGQQQGWWDEACRDNYEQAKAELDDLYGTHRRIQAYTEGRSGGWLVVDGIGTPDEWDVTEIAKWRQFEKLVAILVADVPRAWLWLLNANVFEPWADEQPEDTSDYYEI